MYVEFPRPIPPLPSRTARQLVTRVVSVLRSSEQNLAGTEARPGKATVGTATGSPLALPELTNQPCGMSASSARLSQTTGDSEFDGESLVGCSSGYRSKYVPHSNPDVTHRVTWPRCSGLRWREPEPALVHSALLHCLREASSPSQTWRSVQRLDGNTSEPRNSGEADPQSGSAPTPRVQGVSLLN